MKFRTTINGQEFEIEVENEQFVRIDGQPVYVDIEQVGGLSLYTLRFDDQAHLLFVESEQDQYRVEVRGQVFPVQVETDRPRLPARRSRREPPTAGDDRLCIRAPLPGRLLSLPVQVGQAVDAGQAVAIFESMKMQMEIRAPLAGTVVAIHAEPATDLSHGAALVTIQPLS